jgi:hypothetical protein
LAGTLRGENILARLHYVVGAACRLLIRFALAVGDHLRDFCDLDRGICVGPLDIVDFFIAFFGDIGKELAKRYYAVMGVLKGLRVGLVLFCDLERLVRALVKRVADSVGRGPFLAGKTRIKRAL